MKLLLHTTMFCMVLFLFMACTEDHSFTLDEERQVIVVHHLLGLEIESDSSQTDGEHFFFITKENTYDTKEFDTIKLHGLSMGLHVQKGDSCGYRETRAIELCPNRKYSITHSGMGGRINIQEFFFTDSDGNLRMDTSRI